MSSLTAWRPFSLTVLHRHLSPLLFLTPRFSRHLCGSTVSKGHLASIDRGAGQRTLSTPPSARLYLHTSQERGQLLLDPTAYERSRRGARGPPNSQVITCIAKCMDADHFAVFASANQCGPSRSQTHTRFTNVEHEHLSLRCTDTTIVHTHERTLSPARAQRAIRRKTSIKQPAATRAPCCRATPSPRARRPRSPPPTSRHPCAL